MDGHEYIKVYDGMFPAGLIQAIKDITVGDAIAPLAEYPEIDGSMFEVIGGLFNRYMTDFDYLAANFGSGVGDDGYRSGSSKVLFGETEHCEARTPDTTNRVATVIMMCDSESEIEFPLHGMVIKGSPNRTLIIPSQWTHPFIFTKHGVVALTNYIY